MNKCCTWRNKYLYQTFFVCSHSVFEDALGRFTHVPYSIHSLVMDLTEVQGMFSGLEMFCTAIL